MADTHESYGMIGFSRQQSSGKGPRLFQSYTNNSTFIVMDIKRAEVGHDLGRNWVFGRELIASVSLSSAQFAELLTTMNIGDGVPCTITYTNGKQMEKIPNVESESAKIRSTFRADIKEKLQQLKERRNCVESILDQAHITKRTTIAVLEQVDDLIAAFSSHAPFMLDSFEESAEKIVVSAKAEVDSFMIHAIHKAGLEHLQNMVPTLSTKPEDVVETIIVKVGLNTYRFLDIGDCITAQSIYSEFVGGQEEFEEAMHEAHIQFSTTEK